MIVDTLSCLRKGSGGSDVCLKRESPANVKPCSGTSQVTLAESTTTLASTLAGVKESLVASKGAKGKETIMGPLWTENLWYCGWCNYGPNNERRYGHCPNCQRPRDMSAIGGML